MAEDKSLERPATEVPAVFGREWKERRISERWAMEQLRLKNNIFYRLVRKCKK